MRKSTRDPATGDHPPIAKLPIAKRSRAFRLDFDEAVGGGPCKTDELRKNLSAIEVDGDTVWVVSDEKANLEALTRSSRGNRFAAHQRYPLKRTFGLKRTGQHKEADLEGVSRDGQLLWLLGSHCRIRAKPGEGDSTTAETDFGARQILHRKKTRNRHLLGCIDLDDRPAASDAGFRPRAAATVPFTDGGSALIELIHAEDAQLRPFLALPAKENGVDFEGLAVRGERVFIGLRGPVIDRCALVLEFAAAVDRDTRRIHFLPIGDQAFVKHALPLQGLGVRDLAFRRGRLLVLAAPTMPLDGVAAVFEWDAPRRSPEGGLVDTARCRPLLRLPGGEGHGYPEGISYLPDEDAIAVVVDNPTDNRLPDPFGFIVDVFALPSRRR